MPGGSTLQHWLRCAWRRWNHRYVELPDDGSIIFAARFAVLHCICLFLTRLSRVRCLTCQWLVDFPGPTRLPRSPEESRQPRGWWRIRKTSQSGRCCTRPTSPGHSGRLWAPAVEVPWYTLSYNNWNSGKTLDFEVWGALFFGQTQTDVPVP